MAITIPFNDNDYTISTEDLSAKELAYDGRTISIETLTKPHAFTHATKDRFLRKVDAVHRAKKAWSTWTAMKPGLATAFLGKMVEDQVLRDWVNDAIEGGDIKVLKFEGGFYIWYSNECWAQNQGPCRRVTKSFKDAVNSEEGWRLTSGSYLGRTRMGCVKS